MGRFTTLLFGLGAGAGLMYFLDPELGRRRQSLVRDRAYRIKNQSDVALEKGVRDLRNRTQGFLAEAMSAVSNEPASDYVLAERVRSRLGLITHHPGTIRVEVNEKVATLQGDVLRDEVERIVKGVSSVRGVTRVDNQLTVHDIPGKIPGLQGIEQSRQAMNDQLWSPSTRLLAGASGGILTLYGMARGGLLGRLMSLAGIGLAVRSVTNMQLKPMLGVGDQQQGIRVVKTVQIPAPVDQIYNFWSDFSNFPRFMDNIEEIRMVGDNRSHWVVKGPAGTNVEFDALTTNQIPNEIIAWETVPEAPVKHSGEVRFRRTGDRNTQVNVRMMYTPPAGVIGHAVAAFFGKDPKSQMDQDLMRLKALFTEGKVAGVEMGDVARKEQKPRREEGGTASEMRRSGGQEGSQQGGGNYGG